MVTAVAAEAAVCTHTVKRDENLGLIAKKVYGDASMYVKLRDDNKIKPENQNVIHPGDVLKYECANPEATPNVQPSAPLPPTGLKVVPVTASASTGGGIVLGPTVEVVINTRNRGSRYAGHVEDYTRDEIVAAIFETFGRNGAVAAATFHAESGLRLRAEGWNCYYMKDTGRLLTPAEAARTDGRLRESRACAYDRASGINHRFSSWSVDCGVAQINRRGYIDDDGLRRCPEYLLTLDANMEAARDKYDERGGFQPWTQYNKGAYRQFVSRYANYSGAGDAVSVASTRRASVTRNSGIVLAETLEVVLMDNQN
jgi:hypothetical protein